MGVLNNTAASITVTSGTDLGIISGPPTVSYTVYDTNPGQTFGVNYYLNTTFLWFGANYFTVESHESSVTRTYTFTMSSSTWYDIPPGSHKIILQTENGTGLYSQATISFIKADGPNPKPEQPSLPPTSINPIYPPIDHPTFSDNEVVKMGVLRRIRKKNKKQEIEYVAQRTTQYNMNQHSFVENTERYRNGYLVNPGNKPNEQITFVDARNDSEKWSWVKTTLPNGKIIFISPTFAPSEYIYPLSEIRVTLGGVKYILRNLTKKEWLSIDKSILEKMDFGNPDSSVDRGIYYHGYEDYYIITRTPSDEGSKETYKFLRDYSDSQYNSWISKTSDYKDKEFLTMTYTSDVKANVTKWDKGWDYGTSLWYGASDMYTAWIPVLELDNTDPIIDLPDKENNDPTINI